MDVSLTRAIAQALDTAHFESGKCLVFVRTMLGVDARYPTATRAFNATTFRHTTVPPAGVPVWWDKGKVTKTYPEGLGHVALSLGDGRIRTSDWPSPGQVGTTTIATLNRTWTRVRYRGWSEDINGERIYTSPTTPSTKVSLSRVAQAAESGSKAAGVLIVQKALAAEVGLDFSSGPPDQGLLLPLAVQTRFRRWGRGRRPG